ncbi:protease complex subunit PrcB family protein [Salinisphaera sp. Q1T1-3]|uniref:protease complex subunit PrcB family protein n=1 Tax=Salinisphaera sp. Q1T1-3 TaxID=2321229 RepID=UPI001315030A|nr:protease complex subunit PrcB family protein [Salinisphaera sp. Q1T1-3]
MHSTFRVFLAVAFMAMLSGCATFGLGGNSAGVKVVGKQTYCGTPSQASDVHYFATDEAFQNWVSYRDIGSWHENVPPRGLVVVEMGQRPTGGYALELDDKKTRVNDGTLQIAMDWHAPRLDAAVSQAMTTQCVALALPAGDYDNVTIVDQLGNSRGTVNPNE